MAGKPAGDPPPNNLGPIVREVVLEASRADDLIRSTGVRRRHDEMRWTLTELLDEAKAAERTWRLYEPAIKVEPTRATLVRVAAIALRAIRDGIDSAE